MAVQLLGYILAIGGLFGLIYATFTNEWKVTGHDNDKTVFSDKIEGLWMKCTIDDSKSQCIFFNSIHFQLDKIKVGRSMMIISIVLASVGVLVAAAGLNCTRSLDEDDGLKRKVAFMGGGLFILSGLCALIVICWYMYEVISDFNEKESEEDRFVLGGSLIAGFVAALLCFFGGVLVSICKVTRMQSSSNVTKYPTSKSPGKDYV